MTQTSATQQPSNKDVIRPFQVSFPEEELTELRRRINATKWPEKEPVSDASQGVQLATIQKLARYWGTEYDWRPCEERLKALPNFITEINPDHVAIVIHNYRWRLGSAEGESKYDYLEQRLAKGPIITVPTITLEGDANGAPHPEPSSYTKKFSAKYSHRTIAGGVGHNLPQEAPQAFAQAVVDVAAY